MAGRSAITTRKRTVREHRVPAVQRREQVQSEPAGPQGRPDLPVLSEQPTGMTLSKAELKKMGRLRESEQMHHPVRFGLRGVHSGADVPHSIYEIEGAKEVAIEFRTTPKQPASPAYAAPTRSCRRI